MKVLYSLGVGLLLAGCGGQDTQLPTSQVASAAAESNHADAKKLAYQAKQKEIAARLAKEEYFIGENNLEKIQNHEALKGHAEQLLALLAQADKESRALVLPADMAAVKEFNTALVAVTKSTEELFGGPFLADKAGLYQCTAAANTAYDYFFARQKKDALTENYRQQYTDAAAACKAQINTPPAAKATVYARKGVKPPLNNCLSVSAGNDDFDTYSCPMEIK